MVPRGKDVDSWQQEEDGEVNGGGKRGGREQKLVRSRLKMFG